MLITQENLMKMLAKTRADERKRCIQDINKLNAVIAAGGSLLLKEDVIKAIRNKPTEE